MNEQKEFLFDAKEHLYTLGGKPMTGVTSVLQVIAKPALIQWAANEATKYVKDNATRFLGNEWSEDERFGALGIVLEEARLAHRKKKEKAGDAGTDVHGSLEQIIKTSITQHEGLIPESIEALWNNEQVTKFCNWARENKVKFLVSEMRVYSEAHWFAGTLDFLCEINGKRFIGDIKTSNGIYGREYFAQCAAYRLALEEAGEAGFEGSVVIRVGKDGSFEEKYSFDYETDKNLFLACLQVYRCMGTFDIK